MIIFIFSLWFLAFQEIKTYVADDPINTDEFIIQFDNIIGPQLLSLNGTVFAGGSLVSDFAGVFRIYRLKFCQKAFNSRNFYHDHLCTIDIDTNEITSFAVARFVVWNDRLALVQANVISVIGKFYC